MTNQSDKYCYSNNGMSMRMVPHDYAVVSGEILFDSQPTSQQLTAAFTGYANAKRKSDIVDEITQLENSQTPRRMREAALGVDGGWMDALNSQIALLRQELYQ